MVVIGERTFHIGAACWKVDLSKSRVGNDGPLVAPLMVVVVVVAGNGSHSS